MGKINELAISDSNVNMNIVEKYGTFRLQSDKQITENGKHTADVGFNGLSSVNVNVSGGGADLEDNKTVSITENGVVEITPTAGKDGMKKVTATVNVSGGGGDIPTEWYLWQDNEGYYCYLPFETAPDTLDIMKVILIGDSSIVDTELVTQYIFRYTKHSDTRFSFSYSSSPRRVTYTKVTEDVPIGGGGATKLYAWTSEEHSGVYTGKETPSIGDKCFSSSTEIGDMADYSTTVSAVSENSITNSDGYVYTREVSKDIDLV